MKRRWIVIIFTICFGMGMLLPVHAQEKDKIWQHDIHAYMLLYVHNRSFEFCT